MKANARAERILAIDKFRRDFESANTCAALTLLGLSRIEATAPQLQKFVDASYQLAEVCESEVSEHSPLDALFWFRSKLQEESNRPGRNDVFLAMCHRELEAAEKAIQKMCNKYGEGKIAALL